MGMPSISISFTETGSTAISRGERGIIAMILKDAIPAKNPVVCKTESDAGKMIVWFDGEKVKTARGVNSLTTLTAAKNSQFQKIKIVDTMDMIENDIKRTAEDNYLGRYANTYDNKCLLLSAIGNYFEKVKQDNILSGYSIEIDVDANRAYLKDKGKDVDAMSDDDIKTANTGSSVFLKATIQILDAIEDIVLPITI